MSKGVILEKNKYDYKEDNYSSNNLPVIKSNNNVISYDYVSLVFDVAQYGNEAKFRIDREAFMRSNNPKMPPRESEKQGMWLYLSDDKKANFQNCKLLPKELEQIKLSIIGEKELTKYHLTKLIYPNCKLYYDCQPQLIGNIRLYIHNAKFYLSFSGKILASETSLGYINKDTINTALNKIKATKLVSFNNDVFIRHARVLRCDIVQDIYTNRPNILLKAISSYLPLRTDKFTVLSYRSGYNIIQRGRKNEFELCLYNKGKEIANKGTKAYKRKIGNQNIESAKNIVRFELRLFKYIAQRKFLFEQVEVFEEDSNTSSTDIEDDFEYDISDLDEPNEFSEDFSLLQFENNEEELDTSIDDIESKPRQISKLGNVTLEQALQTTTTPILQMLDYLSINSNELQKARNKYIVTTNSIKDLGIAEFQRMMGCLHLLIINDYDFDKIRSYICVETGKEVPSNYLDDLRERLQSYLACFKPRTILVLQKLLTKLVY